MRQLGISTVIDRVIQQAIKQEIDIRIYRKFSNSSFGDRYFRRAQDAILKATEHINSGLIYTVYMDFEKFFDNQVYQIIPRMKARINNTPKTALVLNVDEVCKFYFKFFIIDSQFKITKVEKNNISI